MKLGILFLTVFILFFSKAIGQNAIPKYTISGYVKEEGSGESLINVSVFSPKYQKASQTNNYGFYSMVLPATDSLEIIFSNFGYKSKREVVHLNQDLQINISMSADTVVMEEVIIDADKFEKASDGDKMSTVNISLQQVKEIPALLGEKDVFKVLQLMPGVKRMGDGNSGLYVRGGGPDQNLIILDDATIYNASHLLGFFSVFNGDAIKSVELIKGGFPARYGGRLSSVIDLTMKEGNKEKLHGQVSVGLLSSRFTLEGPIKKGKSSFLISGRRTYLDVLTYRFLPESEKVRYYFGDLNGKFNYDFGPKNKLYISGFMSGDYFNLKQDDYSYQTSLYENGMKWSNVATTVRWNHLINNKIFTNTSFIFSNYKVNLYQNYDYQGALFKYTYISGIKDFSLKYDVSYVPDSRHSLRMGLLSIYHTYTPGAEVVKDDYNNNYHDITIKTNAIEAGAYIEDTYKPTLRMTMNGGIRLTDYYTQSKNYFNPEPRLTIGYKLKEDLAIKVGYSKMNQYNHLLSNSTIGLPTDLWVPATKKVKPQNSQQVVAGIAKDFIRQNTSLTIEGYYKKTNRIAGYKEGTDFLMVSDPSGQKNDWQQTVTQGQGWSYGIEFLFQKKVGRLTGWIGYTLSWAQLQFDSVNGGEKFYAKYDRRHDVSLVGIYKLKERITLSGTWVYGTGNAITLPLSTYFQPTHNVGSINDPFSRFGIISEYGKRNASRMPAYHRLDIGIQFHKKLKWGGKRIWEISIYNVYNRKNPFFYFTSPQYLGVGAFSLQGSGQSNLKQLSLFPILPSVSYQIQF